MQIGVKENVLGKLGHEGNSLFFDHVFENGSEEREVVGSLLFGESFEFVRSGVGINHEI